MSGEVGPTAAVEPPDPGPLLDTGGTDPRRDIGRRSRDAALALLVRTFVMRATTAAGTIVLARILAPAEFGVFAVLVLVTSMLTIIGEFGVGPALVQQDHEPTRHELATAWLLQQLLWMPLVAIVWIVAPVLQERFPELGADFTWQLRLISLSVPLTMLRALPAAMMVRDLRFGVLAGVEIVQHTLFYGTAVVLAIGGAGVWSFVAAMLAQAGSSALLLNLAWRRWHGLHLEPAVARRLVAFGSVFQGANVAILGRDAVIPLFGGLAGGVTAIGYLQFSSRISQLTATVDDVVARVTFPALSRIQTDRARIARVVTEAVTITGVVIAAPQAWIVGTAPVLVPVVLGERWSPAVPALQLLTLGTLAAVPARFLRSLLFGIGRPRLGLYLTLAYIAGLFLVFPPLVVAFGLAGGGLAFAVVGVVSLWLHVRAVRDIARFPWLELGRVYAIAGVAGVAAWLAVSTLGGPPGLAVSGAVFAAVDLALLWLFARPDLERLVRRVRGSRAPAAGPEVPLADAILAADGAAPVRDPGAGTHQRAHR